MRSLGQEECFLLLTVRSQKVIEAKWLNDKTLIQGLVDDLKQDPEEKLSYKRLERIRGCLCHLAIVYDPIFPYLKGFHLTLASHLPHRDSKRLEDIRIRMDRIHRASSRKGKVYKR